mgnify:CR=1 FL=1
MTKFIAAALALTVFAGAASAMTPNSGSLTNAEQLKIQSILHSGDSEGEMRAALKRFKR